MKIIILMKEHNVTILVISCAALTTFCYTFLPQGVSLIKKRNVNNYNASV